MSELDKIETKGSIDTAASNDGRNSVLEKVKSKAGSVRSKFSLKSVHASGPLAIFNPTNVRLRIKWRGVGDLRDPASDMAFLWRSRDNRKGRNSIAVSRAATMQSSKRFSDERPQFTSTFGQTCKGTMRMLTTFPYYDMAYWVAIWFFIGSALFTANGLIAWIPTAYPELKFEGHVKYASGLTNFFGVAAFEIGALLAYLEAVNDGSFHGSVMKKFLQGHEDQGHENAEKKLLKVKMNAFFHHVVPHRSKSTESANAGETAWIADPEAGWHFEERRKRSQAPIPSTKAPLPRRGALDLGTEEGTERAYSHFRWWPTWQNLKCHYVFEIGWIACTVQFIGATLFVIGGVAALPGILNHLKPFQVNFAYWIPDIVATVGFLVASFLFMLETQDKWYKPQPRILGWWIGFWAFAGSIGFEICSGFGPAAHRHHSAEYQASLSGTWGSVCFLIASALMWYEAVNKNPIEELFDEPGDMKSFQVHPI